MAHRAHKFATMDATRGVAAILVMLFHYHVSRFVWISQTGDLAVDYFFCLSGFIVPYAYSDKRRAGLSGFLTARLSRFYPLYLVGLVVGVGVYALSGAVGWHISPLKALVAVGFGLFMAPFFTEPPLTAMEGGAAVVFPFNSPSWSLFFELAVNAVWGVRPWSARTRIAFVLCSLVYLVVLTRLYGGLGGWGASNFVAGFPRVAFSFFVGTLIYDAYRAGRVPRIKGAGWIACALVIAVSSGLGTMSWSFVAVAVLSPLAVLVACNERPAQRWYATLAGQLGAISYPLYAVSVPVQNFVQVARNWSEGAGLKDPLPLSWAVPAMAATLALAWILSKFFDPGARAAIGRSFSALSVKPAQSPI